MSVVAGGTVPKRKGYWMLARGCLALACLVAPACSGSVGGEPPPGGSGTGGSGMPPTTLPPDANGPIVSAPVATSRFVRLNNKQWENSVQALLRLPAPLGLSSSFVTE